MFLDLLEARQTGWNEGRPIWTTLAPLRYRSALLEATIVIPAEFITDLASVPRLPLAWLVAGARGTRSAVVHDFGYSFGYWILTDGTKLVATRQMADAVFYESLRCDPFSGASRPTAWLMYVAVRLAGGFVWNRRMERAPTLNPEWSQTKGVVTPADEPPAPIAAAALAAPPVVSVTFTPDKESP